jgi:hypothetical protein
VVRKKEKLQISMQEDKTALDRCPGRRNSLEQELRKDKQLSISSMEDKTASNRR